MAAGKRSGPRNRARTASARPANGRLGYEGFGQALADNDPRLRRQGDNLTQRRMIPAIFLRLLALIAFVRVTASRSGRSLRSGGDDQNTTVFRSRLGRPLWASQMLAVVNAAATLQNFPTVSQVIAVVQICPASAKSRSGY
ncbi:MAG: hypothetical protein JWM57_2022 [Phycisphaerales bacterium]|nr:hypothetical protein [Phycisphaerales bacterium]